MHLRVFWTVGLALTLLTSWYTASSPRQTSLSMSVTTDKDNFKSGEAIPLGLVVRYEGSGTFTLNFPTAQRYDFVILSDTGDVIWQWSEGRIFAQVVGRLILSSENPESHYRTVFKGNLPAGNYKLRGILTATPHPFFSSVGFTVR